jgi:DNA-binding CsgD family transcriptional regulator
MLFDRYMERQALDRLLGAVHDGLSGSIVLRGEAGIGKSALLEYAVSSADDMQVASVVGVESEMELGFAGLHQLLVPFLSALERLPPPQRKALGTAFGLIAGPAADLFLVGLAALTLLADAASEQPVLCVVDDAQWLDRASAEVLGFVARRLFADQIGMLFGVREPNGGLAAFEALPELQVGQLPDEDARELLASVAAGSLDQLTSDRVVAETRGNPLALVELGGELTAGQLAGSSPLPEPLPLGRRLEERFLSQVRALPQETQTLLLLASAQQQGSPEQLWRAAGSLGIGGQAANLPELDRLITLEPGVAFRHPLMRSAVYHGASAHQRRRAHKALAAASDPERDPDRRAWHLAAAAVGRDEDVAAELERAAVRARGRGGWASGAAFLQRSAELTPHVRGRAERQLAAAQAKLISGDPGGARLLVEHAALGLDDPRSLAQARRLEGQIGVATGHLGSTDVGESSLILLEAARAFQPVDTRLARDTLLEALEAANYAGSFARGAGVLDVVRVAREMPPDPERQVTIADLLMDGFAARIAGRSHEAAAFLRQAIETLEGADELRWFALGCYAASELVDDQARKRLAARWAKLAREQGALTSLELALMVGGGDSRNGRFHSSEAIHAEAREISAATGLREAMSGTLSVPELQLLAWRGSETDVRSAAAATASEFRERGFGVGVCFVDTALVWLEISLGNYEAALSSARSIYEQDLLGAGTRILPEIVEAGTRCGDMRAANAALDRLSERALAGGAASGLGLLARSRALLAEDALAEDLYKEAIDHLEPCDLATDVARTHLLYGEWLRRQRRRRDARDQLRIGHEMFDSMGASLFAKRARVELRATGEHARQRTVATRDELTPQEERIARLASEGASNQEIATQLFISSSTVAYHLRKVFRKLDIHNRAQLVHAIAEQVRTAADI